MNTFQKYTTLLILFLPIFSFSQKVENIRFEQDGKMINIYYDLSGQGTYDVFVYCKTDDENGWGIPITQVTGAIGKNQTPGSNKEITWNVLAGHEKLTGNISFKIEARPSLKIEARSSLKIEMIFVKGGTFTMGCTSKQRNCGDDEKPAHKVIVNDFHIGKYEVTQKLWKAIMGTNPSTFKGDDFPVEMVSWNDVQKFIIKLNQKIGQNYRLPTEAEWEFAARGGTLSPAGGGAGGGHKYSGSNNINKVAWYGGNSSRKTYPVGTKKANELGIYDMSGNVWEWCGDWYGRDYYKNSTQNNPSGPSSGSGRVLRGGSWNIGAIYCGVANRSNSGPGNGGYDVGFRLVLP